MTLTGGGCTRAGPERPETRRQASLEALYRTSSGERPPPVTNTRSISFHRPPGVLYIPGTVAACLLTVSYSNTPFLTKWSNFAFYPTLSGYMLESLTFGSHNLVTNDHSNNNTHRLARYLGDKPTLRLASVVVGSLLLYVRSRTRRREPQDGP